MINVEEIVFETNSSLILKEGILSDAIRKLNRELEDAGKTETTPMKIVIHIGV